MIFSALVNTFFSNLIAPLQLLPMPDEAILSGIIYNFGEFWGYLVPFNEFVPVNTMLVIVAWVMAIELAVWLVHILIRVVRGA